MLSCVTISSTQDYTPLQKKISSPTDLIVIGKPQQKAKWEMVPNVRICKSSKVTLIRTQQTMRFWEILGYEFGAVVVDREPSCMNPRYGEIIITLPDGRFANEHMAATRIYTDNKTGDIVKASIFLLPVHASKARVLEHEMGHALGWSHYRQKHHIMHPAWEYGGYERYGLKK